MITRIARVAAVGVAALGLSATSTPAQAEQGVLVFVGSATTSALNYPVLGAPRVGGSWTLTFASSSVGTQSGSGGGGGTVGGSNAFEAGDVQDPLPAPFNAGAYCGMSGTSRIGGQFTGTGEISSSGILGTAKTWLRRVGWRQSVAGLIVFEGQGADERTPHNTADDPNPGPYNRTLLGVAVALPDVLSGESSAAAGAEGFVVVGAAALV